MFWKKSLKRNSEENHVNSFKITFVILIICRAKMKTQWVMPEFIFCSEISPTNKIVFFLSRNKEKHFNYHEIWREALHFINFYNFLHNFTSSLEKKKWPTSNCALLLKVWKSVKKLNLLLNVLQNWNVKTLHWYVGSI